MTHRLGDEPVIGRYLIERGDHQGIGDHSGAHGERPLHAGYDLVEIVERTKGNHPHGAELRRLGIDIVELAKAERIFELAKERQAMTPGGWLFPSLRGSRAGQQARAEL